MTIAKKGYELYFTSIEHQENYEKLQHQFKQGWSSDFAAGSYISALPEIFYRIQWEKQKFPVDWYFGDSVKGCDENENVKEYEKESAIMASLSGSYKLLVRAAVELSAGGDRDFDLLGFLASADSKLYVVFLQLLEIRRESSLLSLTHYQPVYEE